MSNANWKRKKENHNQIECTAYTKINFAKYFFTKLWSKYDYEALYFVV